MYLVCAVFGHAKTVKLLASDGCPRCLKIIGEDGNYYDLFSPWAIHSPKAFAGIKRGWKNIGNPQR
jgi:hypothetical protein